MRESTSIARQVKAQYFHVRLFENDMLKLRPLKLRTLSLAPLPQGEGLGERALSPVKQSSENLLSPSPFGRGPGRGFCLP